MDKLTLPSLITFFVLSSASCFAQDMSCPSTDFETFAKLYPGNVPVQKKYIFDILETAWFDDSMDIQEGKKAKKDIKNFPIMLPKNEWPKDAELSTKHKQGSKTGIATISIPESGYIINFHFTFKNNCWYLSKYENFVN